MALNVREGLLLDPSDEVTAALGYYRLGEWETALHYLQQVRDLAPDDLAVQKAVAEI